MSAIYNLQCDRCGVRAFREEKPSVAAARKAAKAKGWRRMRWDGCPGDVCDLCQAVSSRTTS